MKAKLTIFFSSSNKNQTKCQQGRETIPQISTLSTMQLPFVADDICGNTIKLKEEESDQSVSSTICYYPEQACLFPQYTMIQSPRQILKKLWIIIPTLLSKFIQQVFGYKKAKELSNNLFAKLLQQQSSIWSALL